MEEHEPLFVPNFVGRAGELAWLDDHTLMLAGRQVPIFVVGVGGVGKTALLRQWLAASQEHRRFSLWGTPAALWVDLYSSNDPQKMLTDFVDELYESNSASEPRLRESVVVLDGAEELEDRALTQTVKRLFNLKRIRLVVVTSRRDHDIEPRDVLELSALPTTQAEQLFRSLAGDTLLDNVSAAVEFAHGYPLAISMLANLVARGGGATVAELLARPLYRIHDSLAGRTDKILPNLFPRVISARAALVEQLRLRPEAVHELSPRKFEELLLELLSDMGWRVELTPATRDGGKDILAYLNTDVGEILCLVEAKRYRRDRKVGVALVRDLYGTLCDYQANSAMLVTTSTFTEDARAFQKNHSYQLSLRDYSHIVDWLHRYRSR